MRSPDEVIGPGWRERQAAFLASPLTAEEWSALFFMCSADFGWLRGDAVSITDDTLRLLERREYVRLEHSTVGRRTRITAASLTVTGQAAGRWMCSVRVLRCGR